MLPPYIPGRQALHRAKIQQMMSRDVDVKRLWKRVWASQRVYVGNPNSYAGGVFPACLVSETELAGDGSEDGTGDVSWVNPGDITAVEAIAASALMPSNGGITSRLISSDHGFAIPTGATVNAIIVRVWRRKGLLANVADADLYLTKDGVSSVGTDQGESGVVWPTVDEVAIYGSTAGLWGTTWTPAEINAATFGAMLRAQTPVGSAVTTAFVDAIEISVCYTEAS